MRGGERAYERKREEGKRKREEEKRKREEGNRGLISFPIQYSISFA